MMLSNALLLSLLLVVTTSSLMAQKQAFSPNNYQPKFPAWPPLFHATLLQNRNDSLALAVRTLTLYYYVTLVGLKP